MLGIWCSPGLCNAKEHRNTPFQNSRDCFAWFTFLNWWRLIWYVQEERPILSRSTEQKVKFCFLLLVFCENYGPECYSFGFHSWKTSHVPLVQLVSGFLRFQVSLLIYYGEAITFIEVQKEAESWQKFCASWLPQIYTLIALQFQPGSCWQTDSEVNAESKFSPARSLSHTSVCWWKLALTHWHFNGDFLGRARL